MACTMGAEEDATIEKRQLKISPFLEKLNNIKHIPSTGHGA